MATLKRIIAACLIVFGTAGAAAAQVSASEAERIHLRQQMTTMELTLRQAVLHGADMVYAQFKSAFQDRPRFSDEPRVTGFTLPGYGAVFTVDVPLFQVPVLWEVVMREAQYRSATMELQRMRAQLSGTPPGPQRDRLVESMSQLEQQLGLRTSDSRGGPTGAPAILAGLPGASVDQKDADDPVNAYSREVKAALIEAMLINSQGLAIGDDEWLTIVARNGMTGNQQSPGDAVENRGGLIRVKGSVLAAFRAKTISKEEALKQFEIKQQ